MECILNQVDPQFETTQGLNYRLSVLLSQDGFSFLVSHISSLKILKLASYKLAHADSLHGDTGGWPSKANEYFDQLKKVDFTWNTYKQVDVAIASCKVSTVPSGFFDKAYAMNIMSAAHPISPAEEILTESVFDLGPVIGMLVPAYIKENCKTLFVNPDFRSAPAVFVKGVMRKHANLIARQVFLNIHSGYFEITVIQGSRLLYLNSFRYTSPSDVLYYVIFVLEQLGFVPSEEKVTLMGENSGNEIIFNQLKMYCATLSYAERREGFEYGSAFDGVALHKYFTLLNIPE